ncbi:putative quinol monooxygenase [Actinomadura rubrisoli]|uniref:Antibiotic biosynthesis monooxygenase n=1 Tax=Actinomadura rubrisoli TaxID=2530368 RepID=A0A4R5CEU2_9ACTN|nr:antibiotic biosynthesis monooxygenase [Actinomadura rubrisoli]TDD98095.1 antibiotic biosynthesis monooxygenase [Actinomadura rubrisoli]
MTDAGSGFALVVRFTLHPDMAEEFDRLTAQTVAHIRTEEPGTLLYSCHRVQGASDQRIFYELYRDRAAFDAHERYEHVRQFLAARKRLINTVEVDFLDYVDGKTPILDDGSSDD